MSATTGLSSDTDDVLGRSRYHLVAPPRATLFHRIVATDGALAPTLARLTLGLVMFPHGAQKVLGWFGGHGVEGTAGFFQALGVPMFLAVPLVFVELVASVMLILGVFSRVAALGIAGIMAGAVALVHLPHGFFMNWMGNQKGEGFEYHLLAAGLALIVLLSGSGRASIDRMLAQRRDAEGGSVGPELSVDP